MAVVRIHAAEITASVTALLERGEVQLALRTLEIGLGEARTFAEQQELLPALRLVPEHLRAGSAQGALLTAQLLGNTRQPEALVAFLAAVRAANAGHLAAFAAASAYGAWAHVQLGQHEEALMLVDEVLASVSGGPRGIALRARAEALAHLERPGWREAFVEARAQLAGRALGTCWLEEGGLLERAGDDLAALRAYREALPLLQVDKGYLAWLRYNIGVVCLRLGLPEAEDHFKQVSALTRHVQARPLRSRAESGVGAAQRLRGEFSLAEMSYERALSLATENDDAREAERGVGHTLRLAGKPGLALERLLSAVGRVQEDALSRQSPVFVDVAAACLALGDGEGAAQALERAVRLTREDQDRAAIVRAELARRAGREDEARRWLSSVRLDQSCAREEAPQFPQLFSLLEPATRPVPLQRRSSLQVEVRAIGALRVRVNTRPVSLPATGRVGELLVLLLERHGRAPTEELVQALYPEAAGEKRRSGRALWDLARKLRETLGWADSVRFARGVYQLDEQASWWYDVREAVARGEPIPAFMTGVYRDWVQDRAQQLLGPD